MRRFWLAGIVLLGTSCGVLPGSAPPATSAPAATSVATVSATPTAISSPSPSPTTAPQRTATATTSASTAQTVYVGNTDGEGVYIRNTPAMADRARAYPDGTQLTIIGDDVDGDGQHWHHVRTPDGLEGYVPSIYTTDAPG